MKFIKALCEILFDSIIKCVFRVRVIGKALFIVEYDLVYTSRPIVWVLTMLKRACTEDTVEKNQKQRNTVSAKNFEYLGIQF